MPKSKNNNKYQDVHNKLYTWIGYFLNCRLMLWVLDELGYCTEPKPIDMRISTKHKPTTYYGMMRASAAYLTSEVFYATLSICVLSKYISPTDIEVDIWLILWGLIGATRYCIKLSDSRRKYHNSKKMMKNGRGEMSTVGNAVYRKKYKAYLLGVWIVPIMFFFTLILVASGMATAMTHNVWLLPLTLSFMMFFLITAILSIIDKMCHYGGYRPAVFDMDLRDQRQKAFK